MVRVYLGRKATLSRLLCSLKVSSLRSHTAINSLVFKPAVSALHNVLLRYRAKKKKKAALNLGPRAKKLRLIIHSLNGGSVLEKKKEVGGLGKESRG